MNPKLTFSFYLTNRIYRFWISDFGVVLPMFSKKIILINLIYSGNLTYTERWSHNSRPEVDHRLVRLYKNTPLFVKVDSSHVNIYTNNKWRKIGPDRIYFNIRHSDSMVDRTQSDLVNFDWKNRPSRHLFRYSNYRVGPIGSGCAVLALLDFLG